MKSIRRSALVIILGTSTTALAAGGPEAGGLSWLVILFLVFGALIIVFQMIPGLILFFTMLKELFSAPAKKAVQSQTANVDDERNV